MWEIFTFPENFETFFLVLFVRTRFVFWSKQQQIQNKYIFSLISSIIFDIFEINDKFIYLCVLLKIKINCNQELFTSSSSLILNTKNRFINFTFVNRRCMVCEVCGKQNEMIFVYGFIHLLISTYKFEKKRILLV
jgi:hypothetical protein